MQELADQVQAAVLGHEWVRYVLSHRWTLYALGHAWVLYLSIGVAVLLLMWWLVVRARPRPVGCQWQLDPARRSQHLRKWTCQQCGAEA